jgi:hypothetical protein
MKKEVASCLLCCLIFQSCVTIQHAPLNSSAAADMPVYVTQMPTQSYKELSYIEASGSIFHTKEKLLNKLKEQARKENADALVQVRFCYIGWIPLVEGVAVKFSENNVPVK